VEQGIVTRLVPSSATALGVVRACLHSVFLVSVLFTSFENLSHLPATILRRSGILRLLPWDFYDRLLTPTGMASLKWVMVISLLMSTAGYLTPLTTKTSAALIVFYQGLLRSFGHFNHDEILAIYCLIILAFTPCGDAFSVDSWRRKKERHHDAFIYGFPILLMRVVIAWAYFSSALIKLRVSGLNYFRRDMLPALAIYHSLDNLHDTHFRVAFWLPEVRAYLPFFVGAALLWELAFPLAVVWKRVRWWILGFGVVFHLSTVFLMNLFFPYHLATYVVFVDWPLDFQAENDLSVAVAEAFDDVVVCNCLDVRRAGDSLRKQRISSFKKPKH
jgi:hypothetical protein